MTFTNFNIAFGRIFGVILAISICLSTAVAHPSKPVDANKVNRELVHLPEGENPTAKLNVTISQKSPMSSTIIVKVVNMNPYTITFLGKGSPFRATPTPQCRNNEILKVTAHRTGRRVYFSCIMFKPVQFFDRELASELLIEVGSHQAQEKAINILYKEEHRAQVLAGVAQDVKNGSSEPLEASATVRVSGDWLSVWAETKDEVLQRMFDFEGPEDKRSSNFPDGGFQGKFRSNDLNITVSWHSNITTG